MNASRAARQRRAVVAVALVVAALVGVLGVLQSAPIAWLDAVLYDALVRAGGSGQPARDVAVVDIDDASLAAAGQWPWPRYRIAALLDRIAAAEPTAIALDILLPEADRSSPNSLREAYKHDFGLDIAFTGMPQGLSDNDGYLGAVMARTGTVGAHYAYFDHTSSAAPPPPGVVFDGRIDALALHDAPGLLVNADAVASHTRTSGVINAEPDGDGVQRRLPLLLRHRGVVLPHVALASTMRALGAPTATVEAGADGLALRVGGHRIPVDARGSALLRFEGPARLVTAVPAVEVLNGGGTAALRHRIVFVGSSAAGLNDFHTSPVGARFPGLKMLAVMAQGIVDDRVIGTPPWAPAAVAVACIAIGALLAALVAGGAGMTVIATAALVLAAATAAASATLFLHGGRHVPAAAPVLTAGVLCGLAFAARYLGEQRRSRARQRALENARQVTIESMASVAETRDPETGAHIKRTQHYVRAIALELRRRGLHAATLTPEFIELLFLSAPLHDIGKVGIPDHILLKPGRLTGDEMAIMKQHADLGARIVAASSTHIDGDNFLVIAGQIAGTHHEKWDGTGYPLGLVGSDIPLAGRIMAVADIYDAMISRRCYKEPFPHAHATTLMRALRGETFDPDVFDAFVAIESEILDIAARYRDDDSAAERRPHAASSAIPAGSSAVLAGSGTAASKVALPSASDTSSA